MAKSYEDEEKRLLRLLDRVIKASGRTRSSIEEQLEMSSAYVSKVLRGTVDLRVRHLLMLIDAVGLTPQLFFRLAYADPADAKEAANETVVALKGARQVEARQQAAAAGEETAPAAAAPGAVQPDLAWFRWMFLRMLGFEIPAPPGAAFPGAPAAEAPPAG